ncbi:MAG TPA: AAA family ATPase [Magnetospirillaceae bacterium]|nr:AAA family ATPase [Magnetospirillaceae bacterium]
MDELLMHPRTRTELVALAHDAPQGLLLTAPHGTGKLTVARRWAASLTSPELIMVLEPDEKGTITIEATRTLYARTRSKQTGHQVVIIDHAEAMGAEAQNAFLKLLEEPRPNVTFMLTAPHTASLLPTILSRVQTVAVLPVAGTVLSDYAAKMHIDAQSLAQMLFVASGRAATFVTLLRDPQAFEQHKATMQRAKQLLGAPVYERLAQVNNISKDRAVAIATLEAMAYMLTQQIRRAPADNLFAFADALQTCLQRLQQNGNVRAQLTHVFMQ